VQFAVSANFGASKRIFPQGSAFFPTTRSLLSVKPRRFSEFAIGRVLSMGRNFADWCRTILWCVGARGLTSCSVR
jgi:hypothetical protein